MSQVRTGRTSVDTPQLRRVGKLALAFVLFLLAPSALLAYLAFSSARSAELSHDAELRNRAATIAERLREDLAAHRDTFERLARGQIQAGIPIASDLERLSRFLKAAFEFDEQGRLIDPFILPDTQFDAGARTPRWRLAVRDALQEEQADEPRDALRDWRVAERAATSIGARSEAQLGAARTLFQSGQPASAEAELKPLMRLPPDVRDVRGFRIMDLATLEWAQQLRASGDETSANTLLTELADAIVRANWTVGREGEAAVARRAIALVREAAPQPWVDRTTALLDRKHAQLVWSKSVQDELELVYSEITDGQFRYFGARVDSPSIWAIYRAGPSLYAFSFSSQALVEHVESVARRWSDADRDLVATVVSSEATSGGTTLASQALGPWLPTSIATVQPRDPQAIQEAHRLRRLTRTAVVFTAVFISAVGIFWVGRLLAWEVESARLRSDFAASVSHELRSPITQIRLKGEALQLGLVEVGPDQRAHYDVIVQQAAHLSRLIDNVLDFSSIERGARTYDRRPVDLVALVQQTVESTRATLEAQNMVFEIDLPDALPNVWVDRDAIAQVLTNLLSNAVKYGASGGWVGVRLWAAGSWVYIEVADNGMGIAQADLPRVFDDFFRSTDREVRRKRGTGIGLAIVRYIVQAHGGRVDIQSTAGHGTLFTVQLPTSKPKEREAS